MENKSLFLIERLLKEQPERYSRIEIPESEEEKKVLLRALMNIRNPSVISKEFLKVQDDYLKEQIELKGVVDIATLPSSPLDSHLSVWQGDITRLKVDAIVNAANSQLLGCFIPNHSCIDNVIHSFSGIQLRQECNEIMQKQKQEEETGTAKITRAYNLPSSYVIHTVGPIIHGELKKNDYELLASCYNSCLDIAEANGLKSIAFCCISTGEYHFPNKEAATIAVNTVRERLNSLKSINKIVFNVFKDIDYDIYKQLLGEN